MLRAEKDYLIPEQTQAVAQAAFPQGNAYMKMRDGIGPIFADEDFAELYPDKGQPSYSPWRLALITILQYMEGLTDRQAAEAVCGRIDWKYVLGTDATHVLARIRRMNRLELVGETVRRALNELAQLAPEWLKEQLQAEWVER